ncbi:MAG: cell division protein FtsA [Acidobacteriota bacterium]|nr:MAG: cell division protein FtsA [Acidobacteriota bacterium]
MAKSQDTIASIDLGTHRCCCVIAEVCSPDSIEVLGIGSHRTNGIRKGVIVNLEALVSSIRQTIQEAETMASRKIEAVLASVPAAQARSFTSRGVVTISSRDRIVSRKDLQRVLDTVRAVQIPAGQEILHVLPQEYTLDGQTGIQDPVGMTGSRLEASVHVVTAPTQAAQHVVSALNTAQVDVVSLVYPELAAAEAVLSPEELDQGVFLIDCGGGTTDLALFERGALWFTGSLPIAGGLITNDISIVLRTPVPDAEQLKRRHARSVPCPDDDVPLEVPSVGGGPPRVIAQGLLTQIVAPRVQEIFEVSRELIERFGLAKRARAGAVLVGGSANLEGILETAEEKLGMPVRQGVPRGVAGLIEDVCAPSFATPVGLALWELRRGRRERKRGRRVASPLTRVGGGFRRRWRRATSWFGETF